MATQNPTVVDLPPYDGSIQRFTWTLTGTDDGAPVQFAQWADRTIHFAGTFGGGTLVMEGSNNDGGDYQTLNDSATGLAISKTANAVSQITEVTQLARPRATVGVTSVVCSLVVRRQQPLRT